MYTLKIVVELPDKFKPANSKSVYWNMVNSDTLDFPYNDLFRTFKFLYGNEAIINFSII